MMRSLFKRINVWGPDFKHHAASVRNNKKRLRKLTRRAINEQRI